MIHDRQDWFNLARVLWWLILTPVAYFTGWLTAIAFISLLSIWALVETAWGAFQAPSNKKLFAQLTRIEEKLDKMLENNGQ